MSEALATALAAVAAMHAGGDCTAALPIPLRVIDGGRRNQAGG